MFYKRRSIDSDERACYYRVCPLPYSTNVGRRWKRKAFIRSASSGPGYRGRDCSVWYDNTPSHIGFSLNNTKIIRNFHRFDCRVILYPHVSPLRSTVFYAAEYLVLPPPPRTGKSNTKTRVYILAITLIIYSLAACHWALNLSALLSRIEHVEFTDENVRAKSLTISACVGFNVRFD